MDLLNRRPSIPPYVLDPVPVVCRSEPYGTAFRMRLRRTLDDQERFQLG
ncbi:MAG: hypothetical protein OXG81_04230 [Acidobacteria bacterium]|nr:hypothetical protein [Acidobacteriota bacterium]